MDIEDYKPLQGDALKEKIRSLSRMEREEQIRRFGTQYALLCQRLEAFYSPDRLDRFMSIRPGGLDDIDKAIQETDPANAKELALLKSFRELNRVLLPFMDVYEEQTLADLKYMSKDELEALEKTVSAQLAAAQEILGSASVDHRQAQNASGTLRLATLLKDGIRRELEERF